MTPEEAAKYLKLAREIQLGQSIPEQNYSAAPPPPVPVPAQMATPEVPPPAPKPVAPKPVAPVAQATPAPAEPPKPDELQAAIDAIRAPIETPDFVGEARKAIEARKQAAEAQSAGLDARAEAMYKRAEAADREARGNAHIMAGGMTMLQQPQLAAMYLQQARERPEQQAAAERQKQLMDALRYKQALEQQDVDTLGRAQGHQQSALTSKLAATTQAANLIRDRERMKQEAEHQGQQEALGWATLRENARSRAEARQMHHDEMVMREQERKQKVYDEKLAYEVRAKNAVPEGWSINPIAQRDPQMLAKTADATADVQRFDSMMQRLNELGKGGRAWPGSERAAVAESIYKELQTLVKSDAMQKLGALSGGDLNLLTGQFKNPTAMLQWMSSANANEANEKFRQRVLGGYEKMLTSRGFRQRPQVEGKVPLWNPVGDIEMFTPEQAQQKLNSGNYQEMR